MSNNKQLGRPKRIDLIEMNRLLRDGKTQTQIAGHFGVSRAAVSMANKKLNASVATQTSLEAAHKIVTVDLKALEQFNKLNDRANTLLDRLYNKLDAKNKGMSEEKTTDLLLKAMNELRQQLRLQTELVQTFTNYQDIQAFQKTIIQILMNEVDYDTRKRIVGKLKELRIVRRSVEFS